MATHSLELVHLDFLCLEPGKGLEENVLVITDHFTRYAQGYVTRTQMAQTMAKTLWDKFIVHYGLPKNILMDQGCNFESQLVADLCELMGMQKMWTSLYHPQTNGQCERFNSTLINMLGTLPKEKKSEWKNHIGTLVPAYNCIRNSATGFSPCYLMFSRQPCLPVDVALGLAPCTIMESNTTKFVQKLRERTEWAHKKVEAFQAKEAERHKRNYDKKGRTAALAVGDTVLVHVTTFKGHQKCRIDGEIGNMLWKSSPILTYQCMWYAPGMGKGTAKPCIETICYPSILTWGRMRQMDLKTESKITPLQLQCHLWVAALKVVQISLLLLDTAFGPKRNQLPWRYQNFGLLTDAGPTGIWDAWVDLHVCLHILVRLYNTFKWGAVWNTLCWLWSMLAEHHSLSIQGNSLNVTPTSGFLGREGSGSKDIWSSCNSPTTTKLKQNPSGGERCNAATPQVAELRDNNPQKTVKISSKNTSPWCINLEGYGWRL